MSDPLTPVIVIVPAHIQKVTHSYFLSFPAHLPRAEDPHYRAFNALRKKLKDTPAWVCAMGAQRGDFSDCDLGHPLELHHSVIEFALTNEVDLAAIGHDFPQITDEEELAVFAESTLNVQVLCLYHHRGHGGIHVAAYADYEAEKYVRGLIT